MKNNSWLAQDQCKAFPVVCENVGINVMKIKDVQNEEDLIAEITFML